MRRSWPLSGRDDELRRITTAIRPGAAGIVVAGPAGVGKTRLAREAVTAGGSRSRVVWAHGSAAARHLPLGAFAGQLDIPFGDAASTIARAVDDLASRRPLILAVDDAHLLDEHSAIVLHRVAEHAAAPVLVTVRSREPCPDLVTALWKDDLVPRLEIAPLGIAATAGLLAQVLGGPVEAASAHRMWALTEGSPLFLRHLLDGEVSAGRFSPASGIWCWTREPSLSPTLSDLLEHEIGTLALGIQDVVDVVALVEPLAVVTVASLTSAADLEEAERRGLVRVDDALVRLAHPLYGEVRRAAMGTLRARRLRGCVAPTLDAASDPIARAVLTLDSDLDADPSLYLRAAEAATMLYDLPLAERLARAAAATGDPRARLVHAAALSWLSRGSESETILREIAEQAPDAGVRTMAHLHRAGNLLWTMAQPRAARDALAEADRAGALPVQVAAMGLALDAAAGETTTVLDRGPKMLDQELPDELARILVASAVTAAAAVTGDPRLLEEAARVGGLTGDRVPTVIPGFGLADLQVLGHRLAGTPDRALALTQRMVAASADLPGPARLMGLVVAGHAALARGSPRDALPPLQDAWAGLAESSHEFRFRCRTLLAMALALSGHSDQAAHHSEHVLSTWHPAYLILRPDDLLAGAWCAAAEGATTEATRRTAAAAALAGETGSGAYEALAWQTMVQLGDATEALPRLARLAHLGPRAAVAHAHAQACSDDDGEQLEAVAERWTALDDLVAAGDAAAQAATAHLRIGRRAAALCAAALAEKLAGRSGARTPALAAALHPLPLTAREREIVTLAARGLTNRAIADRLTVSVRTVEGHLYRAGSKLGVSDRAAFAHVLEVE